MQLDKRLNRLEEHLQSKMIQAEEVKEKNVYQMYKELIDACKIQLVTLEQLNKETSLKGIINRHQNHFKGIMEEMTDFLEELIEVPYRVLVGKKIYEEVDELIADLEDCIEAMNEELEEVTDKQLSYMEAWDIGVFFEN